MIFLFFRKYSCPLLTTHGRVAQLGKVSVAPSCGYVEAVPTTSSCKKHVIRIKVSNK